MIKIMLMVKVMKIDIIIIIFFLMIIIQVEKKGCLLKTGKTRVCRGFSIPSRRQRPIVPRMITDMETL